MGPITAGPASLIFIPHLYSYHTSPVNSPLCEPLSLFPITAPSGSTVCPPTLP